MSSLLKIQKKRYTIFFVFHRMIKIKMLVLMNLLRWTYNNVLHLIQMDDLRQFTLIHSDVAIE